MMPEMSWKGTVVWESGEEKWKGRGNWVDVAGAGGESDCCAGVGITA